MPQTFAYPHPVNADTSAHSYGESGRIGVAKKEAPERANVRGFGHSITTKQLEQQL